MLVPIPNKSGHAMPPADLNASGISTPKYSAALYGQNASANNAPSKKAPTLFQSATRFDNRSIHAPPILTVG
jgi:hypothetical protein